LEDAAAFTFFGADYRPLLSDDPAEVAVARAVIRRAAAIYVQSRKGGD
jgi:hypothetical protein